MCMCMLNKRTNILFEEEVWNKLSLLAEKQDTSVGELIRNAVKQVYLGNNKQEKIKSAYDTILAVRKTQKNIDYKELINYGRKY
ncbi:MAG: hypothetical protein UT63_C0054G0007 [Candidatus Gottesmanbacteria bacterium GW2011_GWC2_39_8]|uniref:Ribbon-helix-helix protein CopG domain-containing protein n=1 Tax=Candidatus Gottesmanbacteria bacterium GW2011_GWC2_39_8 TaxID=1618450 RepID=A0A0G0SBA2_9BACT|nr:MAG: hypothetical protein UT63_C0054G0007 [Candidatus Gottesmanbacteria bacterium GW2011_GWC2_39_8]